MDPVAALPAEPPVASPPTTFRDIPWRWQDLVVGLTPLVLERVGALLVPRDTLAALPRWTWFVALAVGMVWTVGYSLALARRYHASIPLPRLRTVLVNALIALLLVPVLFGLMIVVGIVGQNLAPGSSPAGGPFDAIAKSPNRSELWVLGGFAILVAPVAEEIFFRGFLCNGLRRRLPVVVAIVVQGLIFGLLHPFNLLGMATIALGGCVLGLLYEWRRTLVASIALHGFQNTVGMILLAASAAAFAATPVLGVVAVPHHEGGDIITRIIPGGAAEQAGLHLGDIITSIEGARFPTGGFAEVVRSHQIGERLTLQILREGKPTEVQVTLKKRPD